MKLSTNVIRFEDVFGIEKTIDIFAEAGFEGIDFNTDIEKFYNDTYNKSFYVELKKYAEDKGIKFYQSHAPFASSYTDEEKTKQRFFDIVKGMEHSSYLGSEMIVVHPCSHINYKEENNYEKMFEYNMDFYKRLIPYAEEFGIKIAIENIGGSITESAEGLNELFDTLNNPAFVVCYDVGHGNLKCENTVDKIRKIGSRIKCTHIHDNDGVHDMHILPFSGIINWEEVMQAFADINYAGNLNYEAGLFVNNLPAQMKPDAAKYMAKVGKYLIKRYDYYKNNR